MGTRGMSKFASLLLGSVASKVIQLADIPVMLIK
jgi:nucleotide-binding universal stress UspA family protein